MVTPSERVPDWHKLISTNFMNVFKYAEDSHIKALIEKTDDRYYYWDKVRSQPLPSTYNKLSNESRR